MFRRAKRAGISGSWAPFGGQDLAAPPHLDLKKGGGGAGPAASGRKLRKNIRALDSKGVILNMRFWILRRAGGGVLQKLNIHLNLRSYAIHWTRLLKCLVP